MKGECLVEKNKKEMTLNKVALYLSVGILVVSLLFTLKSFSDKKAWDKKEHDMGSFTKLSVIDNWRREKAESNGKKGVVLSLISGGLVYFIATNDLEEMIEMKKKKVKKEISKKLKDVLKEE